MEGRTPCSDIDFKVRLIESADYPKLAEFTCGVPVLDRFFHHEVEECVKYHYLSAYIATTMSDEIVAVFTLMNDALMIDSQSAKEDLIDDIRFEKAENIVDFFNRQTSYPAINIGHLGVSTKYQRHKIGKAIIDLVAATYFNHTLAGCQFITVDALNRNDTIKFYLRNSFFFQTTRDQYSSTRRMYRIL
ncbi:MAG: GNAT family N-acetyltransferase [Bacteroides sp.]|nr:GNAT family N-acetyltransferase [Bacteroides sp.]